MRSARLVFVLLLLVMSQITAGGVQADTPYPAATSTSVSRPRRQAILFVADAMRFPDMKQLATEGKLPTYRKLLDIGVDAQKGMIPVVPANSAPNWASLATGTSPGTHGATNNLFHDNRFRFSALGFDGFLPFNHSGETIAAKAEASGLTVAALGWKTFAPASLKHGATLGAFPNTHTGRGVISNYDLPGLEPEILDFAHRIGEAISYTKVTLTSATGWASIPRSFSPPRASTFQLRSDLSYQVLIYDSTDDGIPNYDTVMISPTKNGKDQVAVLHAGQWSASIRTTLAQNRGQFYVKILDLAPDLSKFRLYFTPVTSVQASPESLALDLNSRFDGMLPWDDFYPFWAGLIDDDTFVEQILRWYSVVGDQMFPYIIQLYQPDLVMAGTPVTDIMQHAFLAKVTPGSRVYDSDYEQKARNFITQAYIGADKTLGTLWSLMPSADVFAVSDHGMSASWESICSHCLLRDAGLLNPLNLSASRAVPYVTGASLQVYINLEVRNPTGVVPVEEYEATRQQIARIFTALGPTITERVLMKEQTSAITTTQGITMDMMNPYRTGDVVVFLAPPYTFSPTTHVGRVYGDHGYLPNGDPERMAVFTAAGPDIRHTTLGGAVSALDIVPTIAFSLGISPPRSAEGYVLPIFGWKVALPLIRSR